MTSDSEPSSSARKPSLLRGLLGILAFVFGVWSLSKMSTPNNNSNETIRPQDTPDTETQSSQTSPRGPLVVQSPTDSNNPKQGGERKTPWWEKAAVAVAFGLLIVNFFQMRATKNAAVAAKSAADTAHDTLAKSQRPWVGIFGMPVVSYFQIGKSPENRPQIQMIITFSMKNLGGQVKTGQLGSLQNRPTVWPRT